MPFEDSREWQAGRLRLLWNHRRFFFRSGALGLIASSACRLFDSKVLHLDGAPDAAGFAVQFGHGHDGSAGSERYRRLWGDSRRFTWGEEFGRAVRGGAREARLRRIA